MLEAQNFSLDSCLTTLCMVLNDSGTMSMENRNTGIVHDKKIDKLKNVPKKKNMKLRSACLLGTRCRYDGKNKPSKRLIQLSRKEFLIPVCREQLGGLSTPREPAEQKNKKIFTESGKELTKNFKKGAREVLKLAKLLNIKEVVLKQKSPSCGCGKIYDGTFSKKIIKSDGTTIALLKKNRIKVISEENLID